MYFDFENEGFGEIISGNYYFMSVIYLFIPTSCLYKTNLLSKHVKITNHYV